jgi:hypothetical protein
MPEQNPFESAPIPPPPDFGQLNAKNQAQPNPFAYDRPPSPSTPLGHDSFTPPSMDQQPYAHPVTREHPLRDRFSRKIVALGMVGLGVAGVGGYTIAEHPFGSSPGNRPAVSAEYAPTPSAAATPKAELQQVPLAPTVRADIEKAMAVDTCSTKVTAEQVESTFQRLYGYEVPTDLSQESLMSLGDTAAQKLTEARAAASYIPLPENFQTLKADAENNTDAIPVTTYQTALTEYMREFGVDVMFDWQKDAIRIPTMKGDVYPIKPISAQEIATSKVARQMMVSIMRNFSNMSPQRFEGAKTRLAFGNITATADSLLGQSLSDGTILFDLVDANSLSADQFAQIGDQVKNVAAHEKEHDIAQSMCLSLFSQYQDTAYDSLGGSFKYGQSSVDSLSAGEKVSGKYVTLASGENGEVIASRPYGAANTIENQAVNYGELVVDPTQMHKLYESKADTKIVEEKLALMVTRDEQNNPGVLKIAALEGDVARLQAEANRHLSDIGDKLNVAIQASHMGNPLSDPAVIKVKNELQPYQDLSTRLATAIGDV